MLRSLVDISHGDLRKAITYLQSVYRLNGANFTPEDVLEMAGVSAPFVIV